MANADILIVDDTPANLSLLSQMLTNHSYSVRLANNGARALESARLLPPDLILLDIRMPGMDGFELCARLKGDPLTQRVPVIFISALDDVQDKVRGFQAGGIDYITKPFQLEEVLVRTETHLAMRSLQRQLEEANRKMENEMLLAGKMQANFLPSRLPSPPGWQLAAALKPARETSGDFYNVFPLTDGRLALLIADVVDKGVAAALFMAYCCSLLRTYADEFPDQPSQVMAQVNHRILADTTSNQFVTLFYAVLQPASGRLSYCNAGHPPPLLFSTGAAAAPRRLLRTGIPLGIEDGASWQAAAVQIKPGDLLLAYTDGLTEATNKQDELFGERRVRQVVMGCLGKPLAEVQRALIVAAQSFVGNTHPEDDIALLLAFRQV